MPLPRYVQCVFEEPVDGFLGAIVHQGVGGKYRVIEGESVNIKALA